MSASLRHLTYTRSPRHIRSADLRLFSCTACNGAADHRASSKLFADAAEEEQQPKPPPKVPLALREHKNWTGDESVEDAVLRMLVDKYKPFRVATIRTAEEKLKQAPPRVGRAHFDPAEIASSSSSAPAVLAGTLGAGERAPARLLPANVPLLPAVEGHRPWHTTFKAPSHATSSIKYGAFSSIASSSKVPPSPSHALDERALRKERETKKRTQVAGRLTRAKESTLDYRLGIKGPQLHGRPNPATMRGWGGLVEERIERALREGRFKSIKGRGQPIQRHIDEANPFIAREEFLMNRIVQRQGAAPPWVEVQQELETAVSAFREVIRQSWTRRALRMLTFEQSAMRLPALTLRDVAALRDAEWEARERAYHDSALAELNSLVRKYNGLAPYAVRRPYYAREVELEKAYDECGSENLAGIDVRLKETGGRTTAGFHAEDEADARGGVSGPARSVLRIRDVVRSWLSWFR